MHDMQTCPRCRRVFNFVLMVRWHRLVTPPSCAAGKKSGVPPTDLSNFMEMACPSCAARFSFPVDGPTESA